MYNFTRNIGLLRRSCIRFYSRINANEYQSDKNEVLGSRLLYNSHLESMSRDRNYRRKNLLGYQQHNLQDQQINKLNEKYKSETNSHEENILKQFNNSVIDKYEAIQYPKNWMNDYEFYEGSLDEESDGTADPSISSSTVPCSGCGAHLQCSNTLWPGFIPVEIFKERTNKELKTIICKRCHFLKHYNIALDIEVAPETYEDIISKIKNEFALAIVIIDLLDFPCSIWPNMQNILGRNRPVFIVGNKVDLLPRDSKGYLDHIKNALTQQVINRSFNALNIKYVGLISAKTGYGIEELITQLHKTWMHKGDVYLLGCTNVGKSTLFNILLNSDYCRPEATDLVSKATTCPWPGTTLHMLKFPILRPSPTRLHYRLNRLKFERNERTAMEKLRKQQSRRQELFQSTPQLSGTVGRTFESREDIFDSFAISSGTQPITTFDERKPEYQKSRWCYDTPGVMHPDQITNLLTVEELKRLAPENIISPRGFRFKPGMSIFLAGLARLDFIEYHGAEIDWIKVLVFMSLKQPVSITLTEHADEFYREYLGSEILGIPYGSSDRLATWPGLQCKPDAIEVIGVENGLSCDIVLSSVGWVGISVPHQSRCVFKAWTPHGRGIHMRTPPLIPQATRLIGKKIRDSFAYNMAKPINLKK